MNTIMAMLNDLYMKITIEATRCDVNWNIPISITSEATAYISSTKLLWT